MTQHPPHPQEYIITESQIVSAENNFFSFRERKAAWASDIRSRPHTTPASHQRIEQAIKELEDAMEIDSSYKTGSAERKWWMFRIKKAIALLREGEHHG